MGSSYSSCEKNGKTAMCIIENTNKKYPIKGTIIFHQCSPEHPVTVKFDINGTPKGINAIHIHQYGVSKNNTCKELGLHFNPYNQKHGSIKYCEPRHMGDLINNIHFDDKGIFNYSYKDYLINLYNTADYSIIGRGIVIHANPDDLGKGGDLESLISGNAGERIACSPIAWCENFHI